MLNSPENRQRITQAFPELALDKGFEIIDGPSPNYNCIAWAANVKDAWYTNLPKDKRPTYGLNGVKYDWPHNADDEFSIQALTQIFTSLGYTPCEDGSYLEGYKKVVFYQKNGRATHAARQFTYGKYKGMWTSKLGQAHCIVHSTPEAIISEAYGAPVFFMKKNMV